MSKRSRSKANIPIHRESLFWVLSPVFCPTRPSCPACLRSTLVEPPLQIALFFAKQTQFPKGQNQSNSLYHKEL